MFSLIDESTIELINNEFIITSMKYTLESKSSTNSKNLKFAKYINLFCKNHFVNDTQLNFCYDIESESFLISIKAIRDYFSEIEVFKMSNDKKIRCQKIGRRQKSNLCMKIFIRNIITNENFVFMKGEFHIMFDLPCFLIIGTDFMKTFDVTPKWNKKKSDVILIQKKYRVKITATKNQFVKTKMIEISSINIAIILKSMKIKSEFICSKKKTD